MEVKEIKKPGCILQLIFETQFDELKADFENTYKTTKKHITLPGFRKGRVPDDILRNRALGYITAEFKENYSQKIFKDYIKEKNISIYGEPRVNSIEFAENQPFKLDIEFEQFPTIELSRDEYSDIKTEPISYSVTDAEVQEDLKKMIKSNRLTENIEVERPIEIGDTAYITVSGADDAGQPVDALAISGFPVNVKEKIEPKENVSPLMLDEINNRLVGRKKGDEFEFTYTFPTDSESSTIAGKTFKIKVCIDRVQTEKIPEINDALAKKLDYESADKMLENIKNYLLDIKKNDVETAAVKSFINRIIARKNIDLPASMIENVNKSNLKKMESRYKYYNIQPETAYKIMRTSPDQWLSDNRENAIEEIKFYLVSSKIIELENLESTQDELDAELDKLAELNKSDRKTIKRRLISEERWDALKRTLAEKKLTQFILKHQ